MEPLGGLAKLMDEILDKFLVSVTVVWLPLAVLGKTWAVVVVLVQTELSKVPM